MGRVTKPARVDTRRMSRSAFAHDALVALDTGWDQRAPGGAMTVGLCGFWEHRGPCPVAPHRTTAEREGHHVRLRVLFAAEPGDERWVRRVLDDVLDRGWGVDPDGARTTWRLVGSAPATVRPDEAELAGPLAHP
jgi:hypothetical protein